MTGGEHIHKSGTAAVVQGGARVWSFSSIQGVAPSTP